MVNGFTFVRLSFIRKKRQLRTRTMESSWKKIRHHQAKFKTGDIKYDELKNKALDVEYCEWLLSRPSTKNYAMLNKWLEKCSDEWLETFLECGSFHMMFRMLDYLGLKSTSHFIDAVLMLQVVKGIKTIINNVVGMKFILQEGMQFFKDLINGKLFSV